MVKMPRSRCFENYSNNSKLQPNVNFYIFRSDKQRHPRWLQGICRAQQRVGFCTPR